MLLASIPGTAFAYSTLPDLSNIPAPDNRGYCYIKPLTYGMLSGGKPTIYDSNFKFYDEKVWVPPAIPNSNVTCGKSLYIQRTAAGGGYGNPSSTSSPIARYRFNNAGYSSRGYNIDVIIDLTYVSVDSDAKDQSQILNFHVADFEPDPVSHTIGSDSRFRFISFSAMRNSSDLSAIHTGVSIHATIKAVRSGTNTPATEKFRFDFADLDMPDSTISPSSYNGRFTESVALGNGFGTHYLQSNTTLKYQNGFYMATKEDPTQGMTGEANVAAFGDPAGSSFIWNGSNCGTVLCAMMPVVKTPPSLDSVDTAISKTTSSAIVQRGGTASYTVNFSVPYTMNTNRFSTIKLTDTLPTALQGASAATVTISRKGLGASSYTNDSSYWTITRVGQVITATHNKPAGDVAYVGGDYRMTISAPMEPNPDSYLSGNTYYSATYPDCATFSNTATLTCDTQSRSSSVTNYVPRAKVNYHVLGTPPPDSYTPASTTSWVGSSYTAVAPLTTTHRGYEFTGWNRGSATGIKFTNGMLTSGTLDLYGTWEFFGANVEYHVNKMPPDATMPPNYEGVMGDTYTVEPDMTTNTPCWEFLGWYTDNTYTTPVDPTLTLPKGTTHIYGKWICSELSLEKTADPKTVDNGKPGDIVNYSFKITNIGDDEVRNIVLSDPMFGGNIDLEKTTLQAGESVTSGPIAHTLTQADIDAGTVHNTATVGGESERGKLPDKEDNEDVEIVHHPSIDLVKTSDRDTLDNAHAGDTVAYTFAITNTGNVTLHDIELNDEKLGGTVALPKTVLAPGESMTATKTYALTQEDIDAGKVDNHAIVTSKSPINAPTPDEDDNHVDIDKNPEIALDKQISGDNPLHGAHAGDTVRYVFTITNTGNTTLNEISLEDELNGIVLDKTPMKSTLIPGESTTATGAYVLTQADIDKGSLLNHALTSGKSPDSPDVADGETVEDDDDENLAISSEPMLILTKTSSVSFLEGSKAGDIITYTFHVENAGNVTLHDISVDDPRIPGDIVLDKTTLVPGESCEGSLDYTVTVDDMDDGEIVNHAVANGKTPKDDSISDDDDNTVELDVKPAIALDKRIVSEPVIKDAKPGDKISYAFDIENTGNVTLHNVTLTDSLPDISLDLTMMKTTLAPGEKTSATAEYSLTQSDIDAGEVVNHAIAKGTASKGEEVASPDEETVEIERHPSIDLQKTSNKQVLVSSFPGEPIEYTLVVQNTGNVTLTDIVVIDEKISIAPIPLPKTVLIPGETVTAKVTYILTQADIDAGFIYNHAIVSSKSPDGTEPGDDDDNTIEVKQNPEVDIVKTVIGDKEIKNANEGDVVTYDLKITNTGNTTLHDIVVTDLLEGAVLDTSETKSVLSSGEETHAKATYALKQSDIDCGEVKNIAMVTSRPPKNDEPDITDTDDEDITTPSNPGIDIDKAADVERLTDAKAGDIVNYTFTLTNTGNTTLHHVDLYDEMLGGYIDLTAAEVIMPQVLPKDADDEAASFMSEIKSGKSVQEVSERAASGEFRNESVERTTDDSARPDNDIVLVPRGKIVITVPYHIAQGDLDAGRIVNVAFASGEDPHGTRIDNEDDETVELDYVPSINVVKKATYEIADGAQSSVGDIVNYTFTIKNTGNVTLHDVNLFDEMLGGNIALASAKKYAPVAVNDQMQDQEETSGSIDSVGNSDLENEGDDTPEGIEIIGDNVDMTVLAPGEYLIVDAEYALTQDDLDNEAVHNVAIAKGTTPEQTWREEIAKPDQPMPGDPSDPALPEDPDNPDTPSVPGVVEDENRYTVSITVQDDDEADVVLVVAPGIELAKTADQKVLYGAHPGDIADYTIIVTNTGNQSLFNVVISDDLAGTVIENELIPEVLRPGESVTVKAHYAVSEDDLRNHGVDNHAHVTAQNKNGSGVASEDIAHVEVIPYWEVADDLINTGLLSELGDGILAILGIMGIAASALVGHRVIRRRRLAE